jgi:hypothetical protein
MLQKVKKCSKFFSIAKYIAEIWNKSKIINFFDFFTSKSTINKQIFISCYEKITINRFLRVNDFSNEKETP